MENEAASQPRSAAWALVVLVAALLAAAWAAGAVMLGPVGDGGGAEAPTIPHPRAIFTGEVPCPDRPGGEPYVGPCRQEPDAMDPYVTRIYNGDGVLIGGSTS
jgi:hypothetical protein